VTEQTRREQILRALKAHKEDPAAERRELSLNTGTKTLEVIRLPLGVPVLNPKSFRIAPALLDHAQRALVETDPYGDEAQGVITDLVRKRHRKAKELRQSLLVDGQQDPGVITRSGVLINGNSRCVFMRDLADDGELKQGSIKVIVLPDEITPAELLDLEAVLQFQAELKDEYDLVGELMMLKTLYSDANMNEKQIAARQRTTAGKVVEGFHILALMERARHLHNPPIPIAEFGGQTSQRENWKHLIGLVAKADDAGHAEAGDGVLRQFLALHTLGSANVHGLRSLSPAWVDDHFIDALDESSDTGAKIAESLKRTAAHQASADDNGAPAGDASLDVLGFGSDNGEPTDGSAAKAFLDLTMKAKKSGYGDVTLADGAMLPGSDVASILKTVADGVLKDAENKLTAANKADAPKALFTRVLDIACKANKELSKAVGTAEFKGQASAVEALLNDIEDQVKEARRWLKTGQK
jgi:hypothetical protein